MVLGLGTTGKQRIKCRWPWGLEQINIASCFVSLLERQVLEGLVQAAKQPVGITLLSVDLRPFFASGSRDIREV